MKQYNEDVYIISPIVLENLLRRPPVNPDNLLEAVKSQSIKGSIVLSPEELREMWDECREETWQDARPTTKYEKPTRLPGFEGYMESKGLTIR